MTGAVDRFVRRERDGVAWYSVEHLGPQDSVLAAVSTRHGGVSPDSLASLNLSYRVGDDPARVRENRRRFARAVGFDEQMVVCGQQVHGNRVAYVDEGSAGAGYERAETAVPAVDGLVTDRPGVILWLVFADCVPVLAFDPTRPAVGIAHAGWRGTVSGIARELLRTMAEHVGSRPADVLVAVGPSIGPCCYEIGDDVVAATRQAFADLPPLTTVGGRMSLDLWQANHRRLTEAGVGTSRIALCGLCTRCHADEFYSHRGQRGRAGRMAAVIGLRR